MGPPRHASAQTSAIAASECPQAPGAAARLGVCAATAGGARPASSRDAAAKIAPIASGSDCPMRRLGLYRMRSKLVAPKAYSRSRRAYDASTNCKLEDLSPGDAAPGSSIALR